MQLNEIVKSFLKQPERNDQESSSVRKDNTLLDMSNDLYPTGSFFDTDNVSSNLFRDYDVTDILFKQKEKIMKYRQLELSTDISDAIDEIVNEIIFVYDDKIPLRIDIEEENENLIKAITEKFEKIMKLMNIKRNLFQIVKRGYIDGQLIGHCAFDKNNTKNGIKSIKLIEPSMFYFDIKDNCFKYLIDNKSFINHQLENSQYSIEEIVREDFGLYDNKIILSYLEYAIKPANILKTLEDLLIPMRFSRSISRRVFNVDIGDLPNKRGNEVMQEYQTKFKYKKFYNNETGEVSNQQHITSMVEDYWFSNRSGGKGTTVDVLDESGNLGELGDILYFNRKVYKAMRIPNSRINTDPDSDHDFDYESTRVSKDDMKFFMFISRLRQVYSSFFKEILKREILACNIMTEQEWEDRENSISISFVNENQFIQKLKLENFMRQFEIFSSTQESHGKLFSIRKILKDIFKFSDEEIENELKEIQKEEKNKLFSKFYQKEEI